MQRDFQVRREDERGEEEVFCFRSKKKAQEKYDEICENPGSGKCLVELIEVLSQHHFK